MPGNFLSWFRLAQWRVIHRGPRRDITIETANGRLTVDSKDWLHGKYLYVRRAFEMETMRAAMGLLQREGYLRSGGGDLFLDIGANLGMICIPLVRDGWFRRAVAFEPAPDTFRLLERNIAQNHLGDRITCVHTALSSEPGTLEMELSPDNSGDHRIRHRNAPGAYREHRRQSITVPATTLDMFLYGSSHSEAPVIWLDIQGHEGRFFEGARQTLRPGAAVVSEFWPYAIERSGMSRSEYIEIVREVFTRFFEPDGRVCPIDGIDRMFDRFAAPREMCTLILVRD